MKVMRVLIGLMAAGLGAFAAAQAQVPAPRDNRPAEMIAAEIEAAFEKKQYEAALPGLNELALRREQWAVFMLGNYYVCGKVVKFDCGKALELFRISERPQTGQPVDAELVRRSRNEIAWIHAACEQSGFVRDGDLALQIALADAAESDPYAIDTAAAALANKGHYAQALLLQDHAIRRLRTLARSESVRPQTVASFERRLQLYREGRPARFDAATAEQECNAFD
jgi:hypothetical protein